MEGFLKSMPQENSLFIQMLEQTQAFSEFIHDREAKKPSDPSIKLFDEVILSKKNRGKSGFFSKSSMFKLHPIPAGRSLVSHTQVTATNYLQDTSDHIWRTITSGSQSSRHPTVASNRSMLFFNFNPCCNMLIMKSQF